jgi:hypothetical protein
MRRERVDDRGPTCDTSIWGGVRNWTPWLDPVSILEHAAASGGQRYSGDPATT